MTVLPLPSQLPTPLRAYAFGKTNTFPNVVGISRKHVRTMKQMRRSYIRNVLKKNPQAAYALPDFNELMAEEVFLFAKNTLRKKLFAEWDTLIRETPLFWELFNRESSLLAREYKDAVDANQPCIKHRYLSITAKRRAFALAIAEPQLLAEIELACLGETRYGLPL